MTTKPTSNLAARAGRWSAQHRRKAILGWLAFVFAAVAIGGAIGTDTLEGLRARHPASPAAPTASSTTPA